MCFGVREWSRIVDHSQHTHTHTRIATMPFTMKCNFFSLSLDFFFARQEFQLTPVAVVDEAHLKSFERREQNVNTKQQNGVLIASLTYTALTYAFTG